MEKRKAKDFRHIEELVEDVFKVPYEEMFSEAEISAVTRSRSFKRGVYTVTAILMTCVISYTSYWFFDVNKRYKVDRARALKEVAMLEDFVVATVQEKPELVGKYRESIVMVDQAFGCFPDSDRQAAVRILKKIAFKGRDQQKEILRAEISDPASSALAVHLFNEVVTNKRDKTADIMLKVRQDEIPIHIREKISRAVMAVSD